ncbi:MAG: hypothetical protein R2746_00655 [Acidimicrobiales bacterium]
MRSGEAARAALIASTRRLVVSLARRHDAPLDRTAALLAAGDEALSRAVDRYDPTGGLPFSAFARWWVELAMRAQVERATPPARGRPRRPRSRPTPRCSPPGHSTRTTAAVELRLGLTGGPALSPSDTARLIGLDLEAEREREEVALAKLQPPEHARRSPTSAASDDQNRPQPCACAQGAGQGRAAHLRRRGPGRRCL